MKKLIVLTALSLFIGQSVMAGSGSCNLAAANGARKQKTKQIKPKSVQQTKTGKVGG